MTSTADQAISALRTGHETLTALVTELPEGALTGPSGASEWTVADVLSHLGSGAEIGLAALEASLAGADAPGNDFNQEVWGRWNAMSPQEQADGFVKANDGAGQPVRGAGRAHQANPADQALPAGAGRCRDGSGVPAERVHPAFLGCPGRRRSCGRAGRRCRCQPVRRRSVHVRLDRQAEGCAGRRHVLFLRCTRSIRSPTSGSRSPTR